MSVNVGRAPGNRLLSSHCHVRPSIDAMIMLCRGLKMHTGK